eukprot:TRINITY_DN44623_c0_g1_i1.p1 TRINITY_DN44623_c0_g1~~TRINITY_DN44623_c0_g1_i1.p1  ORF type:complete len:243 (+),score=49.63 TRINITY_DN44623_c0_g1_i1:77-805(+)
MGNKAGGQLGGAGAWCTSCDGNSDQNNYTYSPSHGLTGMEEFEVGAASPRGTPSGSKGWASKSAPKQEEQAGIVGLLGRLSGNNAEDKTLHYEDGSMYIGMVCNGLRDGEGVYKSGSEQYSGQWMDDKQHGVGRQTWSDGRSYDGQFSQGRFSGMGKMVWQSQKGTMSYEGEYLDDLKHGTGKFCWPDGRSYDGEWLRGKRHGRGAYTTTKGEYKIGHWTEDRFIRWEVTACEQDNINQMLR